MVATAGTILILVGRSDANVYPLTGQRHEDWPPGELMGVVDVKHQQGKKTRIRRLWSLRESYICAFLVTLVTGEHFGFWLDANSSPSCDHQTVGYCCVK